MKTPVAEITFSPFAGSKGQFTQGITLASSTGERTSPTSGLEYLSNITDIVHRDDLYIKYMYNDETPWKILEQTTIAQQNTPKTIKDVIDDNIGSLSRCHSALYSASGEGEFTRTTFQRLAPALKALIRATDLSQADDSVLEQATRQFSEVYVESSVDTIERTLVQDIPIRDARARQNVSSAIAKQIDSLLKGCKDLLLFPCVQLSQSSAFIPMLWVPVLRSNDDDIKLRAYCSALCDDADVNHNIDVNVCRSKLDSTPSDIVDKLDSSKIRALRALNHLIDSKINLLERIFKNDIKFRDRPYSAMIYASMAALSNEPEAAIAELVHWLDNHDETKSAQQQWYRLRVMTMIADYGDQWYNNLRESKEGLELYLLNYYHAIVDMMNELPKLDESFALFRTPDAVKTVAFDADTTIDQTCRIKPQIMFDRDSKEYIEIKLAHAYVTYSLRFANLAMDDPDFRPTYIHDVSRILKSMTLDLGCLRAVYSGAEGDDAGEKEWRSQARLLQAEIRRLEARRTILAVDASKEGLGSDEIKRDLLRAQKTLNVAQRLIEDDYRNARSAKSLAALREDHSEVEPVAAVGDTDVIVTYRHILEQLQTLQQLINDLD